MAEFTGERVIPREVDQDLWNEHLARYLFAARLSRHRRVLDLACGSGYGSAELARCASTVIGLDIAREAVDHARGYSLPNLQFLQASCTQVPFPDHSFELIAAFEVIEHLTDWPALLAECGRLLAPGGQLVISTPNKEYYAESRGPAGANPFHVHEFEFDEFRQALHDVFPNVSLFVQNHSYGVVFQPLTGGSAAEVRLESATAEPTQAHFFLAVCAMSHQTGAPTFVYLPTAANILREREHHIAVLEGELAKKDAWLAQEQNDHQELLTRHRELTAELESRNRWAEELTRRIEETLLRVAEVQDELAAEQAKALETIAAYNAKIAELEEDNALKTKWALDAEARFKAELQAVSDDLVRCVDLLHEAERTVEERTLWAQDLDRQRVELENRLSMVQASRWHRVGRKLGLGPEVGGS